MEDKEIKTLVQETGLMLLEKGLVARTWGNISCRKDETHFAISPSGMSYLRITPDDIPIFDMTTGEYAGPKKPSSEKRIHAAAYELFKDVNFVIHTHQDYATAIGLGDVSVLKMTTEEKALLGEVRVAGYGLPGTKGLKKNVAAAFAAGSKVVLMIHHGAIVCGSDRDDAMRKAEALEEICRRTVLEKVTDDVSEKLLYPKDHAVIETVRTTYPNLIVDASPAMLRLAEAGGFKAEVDDMAQMIGVKLKSVSADEKNVLATLAKQDAVLVKGIGCFIKADEDDDAAALHLLLKKAALCRLYTSASCVNAALPIFDCTLMRTVYKLKYSKKK